VREEGTSSIWVMLKAVSVDTTSSGNKTHERAIDTDSFKTDTYTRISSRGKLLNLMHTEENIKLQLHTFSL